MVLVGGGLQGATCLLALAQARPGARVALVERGDRLGGNHTWCMHAGDVPPALVDALAPAIAHAWDGYAVRFPARERVIEAGYAAVTSSSLDAAVRAAAAAAPGFALLTGRSAVEIAADRVVLDDGTALTAPLVVDARGPERYAHRGGRHAYQKFVGLELELAAPHGLERPILMDATVPQVDGFRFFYVLPLGPTRLLVEDTYFSDGPALDREAVAAEVRAYAARFAPIAHEVRREAGVLPLPLREDLAPDRDGLLVAGYQGGWFHPTTGYSFPVALRVAALIARADEPGFAARWSALVAEHRRQVAFATRLNRMLFTWFAPAQRHHVLARFYRLPEPTIRRFYALETTRMDRARILWGRPPRGMSWRAALTGRASA